MDQDLIQKIILEKSNDPWWLESEKKIVGKYGQMFNPINLDRLTKDDFKSFLLIKNNLHWEGIHDRWIVDGKGNAWNIPNVNAILAGQRSELNRSDNYDQIIKAFNNYWNLAQEVVV